jgi:hypothetical protein
MVKNKMIANILASLSPDAFSFNEGDLIIAKRNSRPSRDVMIKDAIHPNFLLKIKNNPPRIANRDWLILK